MSEKQLFYLYEATKRVPKTQCGTFLRCQLLSKCHSLNYINLPAQNFKTSIMCQGCGIELADVPPSTTLKSPPKPTKLIKKIQKAVKKNKPLSTNLAKIYNSFSKNNYQQLITKCQLCGKKNIVKMRKPSRQLDLIISPSQLPNKSKKKKKNLYAGLKKSAVLSVSTNNSTNNSKSKSIKTNTETSDNNSLVHLNQNTTENKNSDNVIDFIPLDMPSTSIVITKSVSSDNRNVAIVNNNNDITFKKAQNKSNLSTPNQNNLSSSNKKKSKKKKNKCKNGRVQKNEVLKKSEKNMKKNDKNIKNLAKMLNQKENTTSSLANFLKNL